MPQPLKSPRFCRRNISQGLLLSTWTSEGSYTRKKCFVSICLHWNNALERLNLGAFIDSTANTAVVFVWWTLWKCSQIDAAREEKTSETEVDDNLPCLPDQHTGRGQRWPPKSTPSPPFQWRRTARCTARWRRWESCPRSAAEPVSPTRRSAAGSQNHLRTEEMCSDEALRKHGQNLYLQQLVTGTEALKRHICTSFTHKSS